MNELPKAEEKTTDATDKPVSIEEKIDEVYDALFVFICDQKDDLYDLVIEYKEESTGKTIRRSWKERDERLREKNSAAKI